MQPPSKAVHDELEALIRRDEKRLGQVYRLLDRGLSGDQIAAELGVDSSGFVSNQRNIAKALLEGRVPNGPSMADQVKTAVRRITQGVRISPEASSYLAQLNNALNSVGQAKPRSVGLTRKSPPLARPGDKRSLRAEVDDQVKQRLAELEEQIAGLDVDSDDYHAAIAAPFALDVISRLILGPMSRTTTELLGRRRLNLSIEQAILDWAGDLPLTTDLIDSARGRLDYWRHE